MAPRGSCPLLFLTLILLATCLAQNIVLPNSYERFVSEHVDFPKTTPPKGQSYCNVMMRRLSLTHPGCRPSNNFIHAPTRQVGAICSRSGIYVYPSLNQCDSLKAFLLTTCKLSQAGPWNLSLSFLTLLLLTIKHFPVSAEPVGVFGGLGAF
uniref:Ribonuclease A-domain domain-containing protein n=1 Tax=Chelonoidis abingdonii TaxID=106734 RepID=A0A8C0H8C6_CHEAB